MTIKQHIRMTASEIAMGRYMRAPDHDAMTAEFDAAFSAEALKDVAEDKPAVAPAADAPPAADPPPADPPADDPPAADAPPAADPPADPPAADAPPAADLPPADPPATDAPPAADPPAADPPDADAIINRLAEAVAKQPKADPVAVVDPPAAEAPPLFNEVETATLAKFKEDWPEEAKAVDLMQRELGRGVIQYVFDQIAPEVKQLRDLVQTLALRAHQSDLDATIGEYPTDDEIDNIKSWVKTQPSYLQPGMNGVIEGGTAEEIGDLVGRYREATGNKPAGAQVDPKPAVEAELSDEAKKAALALAPVGSKRSAVQNPEDASDFDAGWAKFKDLEV